MTYLEAQVLGLCSDRNWELRSIEPHGPCIVVTSQETSYCFDVGSTLVLEYSPNIAFLTHGGHRHTSQLFNLTTNRIHSPQIYAGFQVPLIQRMAATLGISNWNNLVCEEGDTRNLQAEDIERLIVDGAGKNLLQFFANGKCVQVYSDEYVAVYSTPNLHEKGVHSTGYMVQNLSTRNWIWISGDMYGLKKHATRFIQNQQQNIVAAFVELTSPTQIGGLRHMTPIFLSKLFEQLGLDELKLYPYHLSKAWQGHEGEVPGTILSPERVVEF